MPQPRVPTGIDGLDTILGGGLPRGRMYLLEGDPGAGKTTLALQFLLTGKAAGERCLYITVSETANELRSIAGSHGWSLDGIELLDLQVVEEHLRFGPPYTLFHPSELELAETTQAILDRIDAARPDRICFDSLSEVRLLSRDSLRFRRQVLALKRALADRDCTALMLDYRFEPGESPIESIVHGVLTLENLTIEFGGQRRRLLVKKMRAIDFRAGAHEYRICTGGIEVYPRIVAAESRGLYEPRAFASGVEGLDELLGGGVATGTGTMLLGPSGVGKSTLAASWALAAAERGERAVIYLFDETPATWTLRMRGLGLEPERHLAEGTIRLGSLDPAEMGPGEFARLAQKEAVEQRARVVVLDSLNGYLASMPAERYLALHLHELLVMLNHHEIVTILVMGQHGLLGDDVQSPVDLSYLADTVVLLRYFEVKGRVRKALSVVKKRTGPHERTIRELRLSSEHGIVVGESLSAFQGILSGHLTWMGEEARLLDGFGDGETVHG
jgi:circadian clock protein KaiC